MSFKKFPAIYVEQDVKQEKRVQNLLKKFKNIPEIPVSHYGEVFNRRRQNFRLQKQKPSLILAKKHGTFLNPIPKSYGIGAEINYYFSHFLNCPFDCKYCFLQGLYQSANFVLFVNFEEFQNAILETIQQHQGKTITFFSGYDGDSMAMDPLTNFAEEFCAFFKNYPLAEIEFRTKSSYIKPLLKQDPAKNIVVAYTLSPKAIIENFEPKTPSLEKRVQCLQKLQDHGYDVGLRFDPVIYHKDFEKTYDEFFQYVFENLDLGKIHSITLGSFRLPKGIYKQMKKNDPKNPLLATCFESGKELVSYGEIVENKLKQFCRSKILSYVSNQLLFCCESS